jgi:hypothetical protein
MLARLVFFWFGGASSTATPASAASDWIVRARRRGIR